MAPWLQPHSNTDAGSQAINQSLYPKLPFDSVKAFQTVATLAVTPFFLIVNPSVPAKDLRDYIALAKKKPDGSLTRRRGTAR